MPTVAVMLAGRSARNLAVYVTRGGGRQESSAAIGKDVVTLPLYTVAVNPL
jgi:hypothetical protein